MILLAYGEPYELVSPFHLPILDHCSTVMTKMEVADSGGEVEEKKNSVQNDPGCVASANANDQRCRVEYGEHVAEFVDAWMFEQVHDRI